MNSDRVFFNRPSMAGPELDYIRQAVTGMHLSGNGPFTRRCEALLEQLLGARRVLLTTSCTHALEMAALLLETGPDDEVIVPSFTFVSTANAFALRGARIVFADIRPDTLNIDESRVEALITPRTRAIVPVHYAGVGCDMDALMRVAGRHGVAVVEDNAHGLTGSIGSRQLGSFGVLSTLSFHETKNVTCGEGGALIVNDAAYLERAEIVRDKGTNRAHFLRGDVQKYTWVDYGSSYVLSDILAAFLFAQLQSVADIQQVRRTLWERYWERLFAWAAATGTSLPTVPAGVEQSYHMFYVVLPSAEFRTALIARLAQAGIAAVPHYVPLHSSPMGRRVSAGGAECPVTDRICERLLRLPFHNGMRPQDVDRVVDVLLQSSVSV